METYYVDTGNTGSEDGTADHPYKSLYNALNAKINKTFTDDITVICRATGGAADTTSVSFGGWTQIDEGSYRLTIQVDTAHRHDGKWNTAKYRLIPAFAGQTTSCFNPSTISNLTVDGLQFSITGQNNTAELVYWGCVGNSGIIKNCIVTASPGTSSMTRLLSVINGITAYNCIFYNPGTNGGADVVLNHGNSWYYSCDFIGDPNGNGFHALDGTIYLKNCYARAYPGYAYYNNAAVTLLAKTNCSAADTTATRTGGNETATNCANSVACDTSTGTGHAGFTNVTAGSEDFHLIAGSALIDIGVDTSGEGAPLNFTTDIDGETRSGTWDIGADEYVAASGLSIPVAMFHYMNH